jgi:hypothetical protein
MKIRYHVFEPSMVVERGREERPRCADCGEKESTPGSGHVESQQEANRLNGD